MAKYDIFLNNEHPGYIQKLMVRNNQKLIAYLYHTYFSGEQIHLLEIGPGKGYLKEAVEQFSQQNQNIIYYALDRNTNMLEHLSIPADRCFASELPEVNLNRSFDIIFCGFVIEHLKNGGELFETFKNLRNHLSEKGILVLQFPDCMKMGIEFWNIDYTHIYPTTKRNVNMALIDSGMHVEKAIDMNGLLYTWHIGNKIEYTLQRFIMKFYSYKICSMLLKPFYRKEIYDLKNLFYRIYGLLKEENVMFIAKDKTTC